MSAEADGRGQGAATRDVELLSAAFGLAARLHDGQLRKGSSAPYLAHLLGVTELVLTHGGTDIEAAAALLHDSVEDAGGRAVLNAITATCGPAVESIVAACSDSFTDTTAGTEKEPWLIRKQRYIDHLRSSNLPKGTVLVSACDKLHNLTATGLDYATVGDDVWGRFTTGWAGQLWYYRRLLDIYDTNRENRVKAVAARLRSELQKLQSALIAHGHDLSGDLEAQLGLRP